MKNRSLRIDSAASNYDRESMARAITSSLRQICILYEGTYVRSPVERIANGEKHETADKGVQWLVRARKRKCPLSEASSFEVGV